MLCPPPSHSARIMLAQRNSCLLVPSTRWQPLLLSSTTLPCLALPAPPKSSHLANNNISGPLPPAWSGSGYWPRLVSLQLSNNRLSGSLPPSWGTFKRFPALQRLCVGAMVGAMCSWRPATSAWSESAVQKQRATIHSSGGLFVYSQPQCLLQGLGRQPAGRLHPALLGAAGRPPVPGSLVSVCCPCWVRMSACRASPPINPTLSWDSCPVA